MKLKLRRCVANELKQKDYADENLIAFGQLKNKKEITAGGTLGSNSKFYTISKAGEDLMFIPYSSSGIYYDIMYVLHKSKMKNLKLGGFGRWTTLTLLTVDGHQKKYFIKKGRKDLQKIVKLFGF